VFGHPRWRKANWFSLRLKRNAREGSVAYFSRGFEGSDVKSAVSLKRSNEISVRVRDGRMTAVVNGRRLAQEYVPDKDWDRDDRESSSGSGLP